MKRCLWIGDVHRPFHSQKIWDLILKVAIDFKPDEIGLIGDYLDVYNLSMHGPKDPKVWQSLQDEVLSGCFGLDQIDHLFPLANKVYIEGNHETRFERFVLKNAPQLFSVTSVKDLLEMDRRQNWKWVSYGPNQKYQVIDSDVIARHEPLKNQPHLNVRHAGRSIINGHDHRVYLSFQTDIFGARTFAAGIGWAGNPKALSAAYVKGVQNWQWGFFAGYKDGKTFHPVLTHIAENHTCVFDGKNYRA